MRSGQRRPVTELRWPDAKDEEASNTALAAVERDQVLVGTNTGTIGLWDFRAGRGYRGLVRKYGGSVGAVRDIATQPGGLFIQITLRIFLNWDAMLVSKILKRS